MPFLSGLSGKGPKSINQVISVLIIYWETFLSQVAFTFMQLAICQSMATSDWKIEETLVSPGDGNLFVSSSLPSNWHVVVRKV